MYTLKFKQGSMKMLKLNVGIENFNVHIEI